jgi:hypothetical protein
MTGEQSEGLRRYKTHLNEKGGHHAYDVSGFISAYFIS